MRHIIIFLITVGISNLLWAQDFYKMDNIQEIRINFPFSNWDAKLDSLHAIDVDLRLVASSITINGVILDSVGIKFKGNSTYRPTNNKNPLNIKLDYIKDQHYQGIRSIKLSNCFMDPSMLREIIGYYIAGQYMPASKANFAIVYINNIFQGVYTNVQSTGNDFLEEHFGTSDGAFFQCDRLDKTLTLPGTCPSMGSGSALKWVSNDSSCYQNNYEIESEHGWNELLKLIQLLDKNPVSIDTLLNVDRALWMLAFNNFLVNLDSYSGSGHNYLIYQDQNNRFNSILWDLNECFGSFTNSGTSQLNLQQMISLSPVLHSSNAERPLISKLLAQNAYRKRYMAHLRTIIDEAVSSNYYATLGKTLQDQIKTYAQLDNNKFYDYSSFLSNLNSDYQINPPNGKTYPGLTSFMQRRADFLKNTTELNGIVPQFISQNAETISSNPSLVLRFNAKVSDAIHVWVYFRENKRDIFIRAEMFDDGLHDDQSAGDGVFGIQLTHARAKEIQYYFLAENANQARLLPERAEFDFLTISTIPQEIFKGDLEINEFMASNISVLSDESGDFDDWIELHNNTNRDLSLFGYYLTDDPENMDKWSFPDTVIKAESFLLIWADEENKSSGLHANFKLAKSGEFIAVSGSQSVIDSVRFGQQLNDISLGRCNQLFVLQSYPTPGKKNDCSSGTEDESLEPWQVYPIPVDHFIELKLPSENYQKLVLKIYNSSGIEVLKMVPWCKSSIQIDLSDLESGMYILQIEMDASVLRKKIIKN